MGNTEDGQIPFLQQQKRFIPQLDHTLIIIYMGKKYVRRLKLPDNTITRSESWKLAVDVFRQAKKKKEVKLL